MCLSHCYLDYDKSGVDAEQRAERESLLILADVNFATCPGLKESEIEDTYDERLYSEMLQRTYGVSTMSPKFRGQEKWSSRLRDTFKHQGKPWSEQIEASLKLDIAKLVDAKPGEALCQYKRGSFDALVKSLETKLATLSLSRQ
jgi:putative ATP-dependent endonuclease of the OLD family